MRAAAPGLAERQVQGVLEGTFRTLGSPRNGYGSIVAGGRNATILHYHENDQPLAEDGLLLIDAGAEVGYYTADITRTFPVSPAVGFAPTDMVMLPDVVPGAGASPVLNKTFPVSVPDPVLASVRKVTSPLPDEPAPLCTETAPPVAPPRPPENSTAPPAKPT